MACMKVKHLEQLLQDVNTFEHPKISLEQYSITPHLAACSLHTIQARFGDIEGKLVADLGIGCGMLGFGAALLGATHTIGFEIDEDALEIFLQNKEDLDMDNLEAVHCDINHLGDRWTDIFDTVVMNPPFGTRQKGIDVLFVQTGLKLANVVYSLHKTSTRNHLLKKSKEWGVKSDVVAELRFDLPSTYKFHSKNSVDINVDLFQFKRG